MTIAALLYRNTEPSIRADDATYANLIRSNVSYAGSMRSNAIVMLDNIGLHDLLEIASSEQLFAPESTLAATTSALVYPVFALPALTNFSGMQMLGAEPLFREMLTTLLAPRLRAAPDALIVPFGKSAASGLDYLIQAGQLQTNRVLRGFPHPSGQNGHRVEQFRENRLALCEQLNLWFQ